jgi:hypothetical protein
LAKKQAEFSGAVGWSACHSGGIFFNLSTVLDNKKDASSMTSNND